MDNFYLDKSNIHGEGVFSKNVVFPGERMFKIAAKDPDGKYKITELGSKLNHSTNANSCIVKGSELYLYALRLVVPGNEITINYSNTYSLFKKT